VYLCLCHKVFKSTTVPHEREGTLRASPQPGRWSRRPSVSRRKSPTQLGYDGKNRKEWNEDSSSEDSDSIVAKTILPNPSKHLNSTEDSDYTDNSSGKTASISTMFWVLLEPQQNHVFLDSNGVTMFCCYQMWLILQKSPKYLRAAD